MIHGINRTQVVDRNIRKIGVRGYHSIREKQYSQLYSPNGHKNITRDTIRGYHETTETLDEYYSE